MAAPRPVVVVTDLDGTLLDHHTYEAGPAAPQVAALQAAGAVIVCCSAKTRAEQLVHRHELGITGPFIVENGAAVCTDATTVRVLGLGHREVRTRLRAAARDLGVTVRGFADMDVAEVAERTELSLAAAELAMRRDHTEPFVVVDADPDEATLRDGLRGAGLGLQRGSRFWTASGRHDKGAAVAVLRELLAGDPARPPLLYGLGDTHNDTAMLAAVDVPLLVQRPGGTWADIALDRYRRVEGVGPIGWARAADEILHTLRRV
jgi:mannosyl-3-phosphoglycerate phosphatase